MSFLNHKRQKSEELILPHVPYSNIQSAIILHEGLSSRSLKDWKVLPGSPRWPQLQPLLLFMRRAVVQRRAPDL